MRSVTLCKAVLLFSVLALSAGPGLALGPGEKPANQPQAPQGPSALDEQFFTFTGKIFVSVDGAGSNNASHTVEVQKPNASATVRKAFLLSATTYLGGTIPNNTITLDGVGVSWNGSRPGPLFNNNYWADVTTTVKTKVDAASPGRVPFTLVETASNGSIDGEILAVVFDDPTQTQAKTVIFLFGDQALAGDTFAVTLAQPIDPAAPGAVADMGLGISFSHQGSSQYSVVEVNGQRLTTSAGGEDDGATANGALITVGGLDDSNANPANPNALPTNPRSDDELYTLLPFLTPTTTSISVFTRNPSSDDNIFFAYFVLSGAALVGEGVVLGPATATNPVGTQHTVTATVVDGSGAPMPGVQVTFTVVSGPNAGQTDSSLTNSSGIATWTYTGSGGPGTDLIRACIPSGACSTLVEKVWVGAPPTPTPPPQAIPSTSGSGMIFFAALLALAGAFLLWRARM